MKVFILGDVHGNPFALSVLLKKAKELGCEKVICTGDISGYFTGINQVIDLLRESNSIAIKGNHDVFLKNPEFCSPDKSYHSALLKTLMKINSENLDWVNRLQDSATVLVDNKCIKVYHGGPVNLLNQYVFPDQIDLSSYDLINADLIVFGHTHLQFVVKIGGKTFINPGSTGLPRNGDFRAHGILYDTSLNHFTTYRLPYEVNEFLRYVENDSSVNRKYFHNIFFGKSSHQTLVKNRELFFTESEKSSLTELGFTIINKEFGAIISSTQDLFLQNIIYVAVYDDGSVSISSNVLVYGWQIPYVNKKIQEQIENDGLVKDKAGFAYFKSYTNVQDVKDNPIKSIIEPYLLISKYNISNAQ